MELVFHRLVQQDVWTILGHYEQAGGSPLADRFFPELEDLIQEVASEPRRLHPTSRGLRRANMATFPFHLLFRELPSGVYVLVLRHHKRHPSFGLSRQ